MLRSPLIHPQLLAALGAAGHGARVLIADANYSHSTNVYPGAALIHLNVRPGLVTVDQVLEPVIDMVPIESVSVMQPDDGSTPEVFARYRELLGDRLPLQPLRRLEFYATCREADLAVCVATGDDRLYTNVLLTVGYISPRVMGSDLRKVPLGRTGLRVSQMVFGGAPIGGLYELVGEQTAAEALEAAWAAGIRAFDTAPHYGVGLSERRIGAFLAGRPRAEFVLSTKVGRRLVAAAGDVQGADGFYGTPQLARVRDYSRDGVLAALEDSLRRLCTDRIDIALIHDPDDHAEQALEGAYAALDQLRTEKVIRAVGVGMNQAGLLQWFVERADLDCVLVAGRYSLLDASAAAGLLPACQQRGVAVLAAGIFNSGILADPRPGATYDYAPAPDGLLERAQRIRAVCARHGVPIGAAALHFVLRHPAVTAVVAGARNAAEVTEDVRWLTAAVPGGLFAELAEEGLIPDPSVR